MTNPRTEESKGSAELAKPEVPMQPIKQSDKVIEEFIDSEKRYISSLQTFRAYTDQLITALESKLNSVRSRFDYKFDRAASQEQLNGLKEYRKHLSQIIENPIYDGSGRNLLSSSEFNLPLNAYSSCATSIEKMQSIYKGCKDAIDKNNLKIPDMIVCDAYSSLIMPVQRLPRYQMLSNTYLKNEEEERKKEPNSEKSPQTIDMEKMSSKFADAALFINNAVNINSHPVMIKLKEVKNSTPDLEYIKNSLSDASKERKDTDALFGLIPKKFDVKNGNQIANLRIKIENFDNIAKIGKHLSVIQDLSPDLKFFQEKFKNVKEQGIEHLELFLNQIPKGFNFSGDNKDQVTNLRRKIEFLDNVAQFDERLSAIKGEKFPQKLEGIIQYAFKNAKEVEHQKQLINLIPNELKFKDDNEKNQFSEEMISKIAHINSVFNNAAKIDKQLSAIQDLSPDLKFFQDKLKNAKEKGMEHLESLLNQIPKDFNFAGDKDQVANLRMRVENVDNIKQIEKDMLAIKELTPDLQFILETLKNASKEASHLNVCTKAIPSGFDFNDKEKVALLRKEIEIIDDKFIPPPPPPVLNSTAMILKRSEPLEPNNVKSKSMESGQSQVNTKPARAGKASQQPSISPDELYKQLDKLVIALNHIKYLQQSDKHKTAITEQVSLLNRCKGNVNNPVECKKAFDRYMTLSNQSTIPAIKGGDISAKQGGIEVGLNKLVAQSKTTASVKPPASSPEPSPPEESASFRRRMS